MKFGAEAIDIRIALYEEGFVTNLIPSANCRCLPMCEVIDIYVMPLDCKGRILVDQRKYGKTHEHET